MNPLHLASLISRLPFGDPDVVLPSELPGVEIPTREAQSSPVQAPASPAGLATSFLGAPDIAWPGAQAPVPVEAAPAPAREPEATASVSPQPVRIPTITAPAPTSVPPAPTSTSPLPITPTASPTVAPAQTAAAPEDDGSGPSFANFRANGGMSTLGAIGIGLLGSPTMAGGLSTGLQLAQRNDSTRAATDLAKVELGLKRRKLLQEEAGNNATLEALVAKGVPRADAQAAIAASVAGNREALSNLLNNNFRKEPDAPAGYRLNKDGSASFIPGGPQDPATIGAQSQARQGDSRQLVDVPQPDGSTAKMWLGKGETAGPAVGANKPAAPNVREFAGPDGVKRPFTFDSTSGHWREMDVGGGAPAGAANPYATGRFNNDQGKAAGFADRMMGTEGILRSTESVNTTPGFSNIAGSSAYPNAFKSDDRQKMEQAQRDFVNAQLRRESGAAISQKEFDNARQQYFPQPGDGEAVIAQKRVNRQRAIEAMGREGGPSYRPGSVFDRDGAIVPYRPPGSTPAAPSRSALEAEARRRGLTR